MLRNENWNYAVFTLEKQHRPGINQAECLACHKPHSDTSYIFTLKELAEAAKAK
jgi:predicted CXXCH cytochrome family protein